MTEVVIRNEHRLVEFSGIGLQGPSGAMFHVVDDVSELVASLGNNGDTAITIKDGHEYRKIAGGWLKTGRMFWGTLLPETIEAKTAAVTAAVLAQKWAEYPEDSPVADGAFSARHWALKTRALGSASLEAIARATDAGLVGLGRALDAALRDIELVRSAALHDVDESAKAAAEYWRLTGIDARATAEDRLAVAEDRAQISRDKKQTGEDRSAVAQDKADVQAAITTLRTIYGVHVWHSNGSALPVGHYLATAFADRAGVFDRLSVSVPAGVGTVLLQLTINEQPVSAVYAISAGSLINLAGQSINIAQGDRVAFSVLGGAASQLWAQITGLIK